MQLRVNRPFPAKSFRAYSYKVLVTIRYNIVKNIIENVLLNAVVGVIRTLVLFKVGIPPECLCIGPPYKSGGELEMRFLPL